MIAAARHIVRLAAVLGPFLMFPACRGGFTAEMPQEQAAVLFGLTVEVLGSASADGSVDLPEIEKMNTLRIVVLHPDGTVEHNRFVDFGRGMQSEYTRFLEVRRNETKRVYLIANEQSVSSELHAALESYAVGSSGFAEAVAGVSFVPDYSRPLPMSSVYEVEVEEVGKECRFYLVRAAAKFVFRFINQRAGAVTVNSIAVSDIAGETFLMPRKIASTMLFRQTDASPAEELYWIDWLKRVSDEARQYPDDKELADRRGWILDYDVPPTAHRTVVVDAPDGVRVAALAYDMGVPRPGVALFPVFYLPESKCLKAASELYGEQEYVMTIRLTDADSGQKTFVCPFGNLKSLFRNTHVAVDVTFLEKGMSADVVPYREVLLDPGFGL